MFVPLFLTGGSVGTAFAQSIVRSSSVDLYAAVGRHRFCPQATKHHSPPLFLSQKRPAVMLLSFLLSSEPPWRMQFPETRLPRVTSVCMKAKKCGKYRLTHVK